MIIIPMAGVSRRFTERGYTVPKYMLPLREGSVFSYAVRSFRAYFDILPFVFVARDVAGTESFIAEECRVLGIKDVRIHILENPTAGQAETVHLGLSAGGIDADAPLTIFNIDTFRPGFRFPSQSWLRNSDGYLEVFHGEGANWSYVRPKPGSDQMVAETAEKRPISDLCCTGLYHFARAEHFNTAFLEDRDAGNAGELYVAPLYNRLLKRGMRIHYSIVAKDEIVFCGVPSEYESVIERETNPARLV